MSQAGIFGINFVGRVERVGCGVSPCVLSAGRGGPVAASGLVDFLVGAARAGKNPALPVHRRLLSTVYPPVQDRNLSEIGAIDKPCGESVRRLTQNCC